MKNCGFIVAMVVVQFAYGGSNILIKIALERGLNQFVLIVYRHIIAMLLLAPPAYVLERKERPSLSVSVFGKIFLLSSLGTTIHLNVYYAGLAYTSPTVATALGNVIPSLTFVMAVLLRMEKVKIKSARGGAKVLGTVICIGGSLVFTFWRGGFQSKGFVDRPLINIHNTNASHGEFRHGNESWIKGSALFLVSYIAWSGWLILQATASKVYPAQLSLNVLICFIASLQSSVLALFFARNPLLWKLQWNVQLLTIIYSGVVLSALVYYLQTWCISNKGPVFAAMFTPLLLVFVALFSAIVFAERLHLGSLVGAFLIILGLYLVLWAKRRDSFVSGNTKDGDDFPDDKKLVISTINCTLASDKSVKVEAIN
ncbi:hypothetical protein QUC31_008446 [Theobroma cacao]|uniref:WAT1-related protein n=1 Tax=Theobroma cacao TaxID=3641 RepID=A0A061G1S6_THECC|nr:Nodulin MtN21 /EamA-like transporter family protein isoform 3 [Theobroma cacao]